MPILLASSALAGAVSFTAKPTAVKDGDSVKIRFAVSAPTDVEVAIVNAECRVVRSLAAGVLGGKNPPPEPLKPGLAQSPQWDRKANVQPFPSASWAGRRSAHRPPFQG